MRSCQRTQRGLFYGFSAFETNWKGEKALQVGASWPNHKSKKLSFWSVIFSYSIQQQRTVSLSDCDMWRKVDFIQQLAMTNSVIRSIRISKALPKAKLAPKKGRGHCLAVCCWSDPLQLWVPVKPLHLSKSMRCMENCNACSWHWSTESAQFFSTTMLDHMSHNQCFKGVMNWAMKFSFIHHIHLTSC